VAQKANTGIDITV